MVERRPWQGTRRFQVGALCREQYETQGLDGAAGDPAGRMMNFEPTFDQ
jgi:hypothetical protein